MEIFFLQKECCEFRENGITEKFPPDGVILKRLKLIFLLAPCSELQKYTYNSKKNKHLITERFKTKKSSCTYSLFLKCLKIYYRWGGGILHWKGKESGRKKKREMA